MNHQRHFPRGFQYRANPRTILHLTWCSADGNTGSHIHSVRRRFRFFYGALFYTILTLSVAVGSLLASPPLLAAPLAQTDDTPADISASTTLRATAIQQLQEQTAGVVTVAVHPTLGTVRLVQINAGNDLVASQALDSETTLTSAMLARKANSFFANHGDLFGLDPAITTVTVADERVDSYGYTLLVHQEMYRGVPIFGARLHTHFNAQGQLTAVNGIAVASKHLQQAKLNTTPTLSAEEARAIAIGAVYASAHQLADTTLASNTVTSNTVTSNTVTSNTVTSNTATLTIYQAGMVEGQPGRLHLAYRVEVVDRPNFVRQFVFVDAHSGEILDNFSGIHSLEREVSEGSLGNVVWDEGQGHSDPIPNGWSGGNGTQVQAWNDEISGAKEAYYFFGSLTNGGRLSYDGADAVMRTVNNDPMIQCPNAVWDGLSANYCNGVTADDIVVHEWGHAYTEYTSDLIYAWQPGALNESFSDIWGETADLINSRGTDIQTLRTTNNCSTFSGGSDHSTRWLVGEDAPSFGGAIRDMWNPRCYENPGKVSDSAYLCTTDDLGGVHINSGVPNHLYALLVDGGTYNGRTVNAIGLTRAAHLFWRAQTAYLTAVSDFADLADSLTAACTDLTNQPLFTLSTEGPSTWGVAPESINSNHCNVLATAIEAVELRRAPSQCNFQPLLSPNAPPLCSDTQQSVTIALQTWENGLGTWQVGQEKVAAPAQFNIPHWSVVGNLPSGRAGNAAFGPDPLKNGDMCQKVDESGVIYLQSPTMTIPAYANTLRIAFDHWMASENAYDGGIVQFRINGGSWVPVPKNRFLFNAYNSNLAFPNQSNSNPLAGLDAFTGADAGSVQGSWGQSQIDLTGVAAPGNTLQLRFDFGLDACTGLVGWYVDDVRVYSCANPNDLGVRQQAPTAAVLPGEEITVQILVDNNGQPPTTNVTVSDALPATLSYVATTQQGPVTFAQIKSAPDLAWHVDQILGSLTSTLNLKLRVRSDLNRDQGIVNRATVSADNDGTANNNSAESTINVVVPRLGFAQGSYQVEEGDSALLLIAADRTNPHADMVVSYLMSAESAEAGSDYTAASGEIRVTRAMTSVQLPIPTTEDSERENDERFRVVLSAPRGALLTTAETTVTIVDDDHPGVTITPLVGLTDETGQTAIFDLVLKTKPNADVVIVATSSNPGEGVTSGALTFTTANWNNVQQVTVSGIDDSIDDGDQSYDIALRITSSDGEYAAVTLPALALVNQDDDVAALTLDVAIEEPAPSINKIITYTYMVTNSGTVTVSELNGTDTLFGALNMTPTTLLAGEWTSLVLTRTTVISDLIGATPQATTVSALSAGGNLVNAKVSPLVNLLDVGFHLTATVGIEGIGQPCAARQKLQVPSQSRIVRRYGIENSVALPLTPHTIVDSRVGTLQDQIDIPLAAGASFIFSTTEVVSSDSMGNITWRAGVEYAPPTDDPAFDEPLFLKRTAVVTVTVSSASDDLDEDGIPDNIEGAGDPDNDQIPNYLDTDSDGDMLLDKDEAGDNPLQPRDRNGNGIPDYLEFGSGLTEIYMPVIRR